MFSLRSTSELLHLVKLIRTLKPLRSWGRMTTWPRSTSLSIGCNCNSSSSLWTLAATPHLTTTLRAIWGLTNLAGQLSQTCLITTSKDKSLRQLTKTRSPEIESCSKLKSKSIKWYLEPVSVSKLCPRWIDGTKIGTTGRLSLADKHSLSMSCLKTPRKNSIYFEFKRIGEETWWHRGGISHQWFIILSV